MALSPSKGQEEKDTVKPPVPAYFYVLRLRSGALYIGATKDLESRYHEHSEGKACRTTKFDPPRELVHCEEYQTFSDARRREAQVKRWSRAKKEALMSGELAKLRELSKSRKRR
jgi:putative endonuclease